jgi:hypothetical protein
MTRLSGAGAAMLAATFALCASSQAATVSGKFELDGKATVPTQVAAFRMRDQNAPRTIQTYVMLTTKAVNRDAIKDSVDPYAVAINDPAVQDTDYVAFEVGANGETHMNAHVGGTQYVDSSGKIMGQQGSLVANCRENTATRVACTVKTEKPVKTMGGPSFSLELSFDTEISARPPGKPIAADGGDPGKALMALNAAAGGNDLAKILALMTPGAGKSYREDWRSPAENLAEAKDFLKARLPKEPKITGGELLADDYAVLEVEGVPFKNGRMLYLIEMRLSDGHWVYEQSGAAGFLR